MAKPLKRKSGDQLPPHSEEAERAFIGCLLVQPRRLADCHGMSADSFYLSAHRSLFPVLLQMHAKGQAIDVITVYERLKVLKLQEECGGLDYLQKLELDCPSAENFSYWRDIILDKALERQVIDVCTGLSRRVFDGETPIVDLIAQLDGDVCDLMNLRRDTLSESVGWEQLLEFDTENDPNNVIGLRNGKTTRYLCKGHGAWLIGPSGVGKSSLALQMGISFAVGRPFFAVTPMRALRVLVVQAENDKGDIAEMARGIEAGLKIDAFSDEGAPFDLLKSNLKVVSITGKTGQPFCQWLERQILAFAADLVMVDPLLSFAGIDVSRTDQASQFCRVWLDPVLRRTGAVMISTHHTGKPKQERGKAPESIYDQMYSGLGSSELVNWARAVLLLQPVGDQAFKLVFAKRGKRAWATHLDDRPTQVVWLRHAVNGNIYWEQIEPPEEEQEQREAKEKPLTKPQQIAAANLGTFLSKCPKEGEGLRAIVRRLKNWLASKDSPKKALAAASDKTIRDSIALMLDNQKLMVEDGMYFKGDQA